VQEQAGVKRAAAVITCTEDDLTNLEIALIARELKGDIRVVLRMFDYDMAQKIARGFDIQTAFSTSALAAPAFARAATHADVTHAFYVGEQLLNVSEMMIGPGSTLIGRQICDLEHELDFSIILHCRGGQVDLHPNPEILLEAGDQIYLLASMETLNRLGRMNS
jgi:Trk K+ transport system NAD-binding subunit